MSVSPVGPCTDCGQEYKNSFNRNNSRCDDCYPFYRKAVNLVAASKNRSRKYGIENTLTAEILIPLLKTPCPQTGETFRLDKTGSNYSDRDVRTPSVDKIDPSRGYTEDNIQVVCWGYNLAKARFSDKEVIDFWKKVVAFHALAENPQTDSQYKTTDGVDVLGNAVDEISIPTE